MHFYPTSLQNTKKYIYTIDNLLQTDVPHLGCKNITLTYYIKVILCFIVYLLLILESLEWKSGLNIFGLGVHLSVYSGSIVTWTGWIEISGASHRWDGVAKRLTKYVWMITLQNWFFRFTKSSSTLREWKLHLVLNVYFTKAIMILHTNGQNKWPFLDESFVGKQ